MVSRRLGIAISWMMLATRLTRRGDKWTHVREALSALIRPTEGLTNFM